MKRFSVLMMVGMVVLAGCSDNSEIIDDIKDNEDNEETIEDVSNLGPAATIELSRAEAQATDGINEFGWNAFDAMSDVEGIQDENMVMSPLGLTMALSMGANGADTETRQEMIDAMLGSAGNIEDLNSLNSKLTSQLPTLQKASTFVIKNSVWTVEDAQLIDGYEKAMASVYDATIAHVDDETKAVGTVNQWVSDHTGGMITRFLDEDTKFEYLALNVLYLKGIWETPFDKNKTVSEVFNCADGEQATVPFMHETIELNYYEDEKVQICDIPYKQRAFSMAIVLPKEGVSTSDVVTNTLMSGDWQENLQQSSIRNVTLSLPKFKVEFGASTDIWESVLRSMGINSLFDNGLAEAANDKVINIAIHQKCVIEIDEEGAKAAAATGVGGDTMLLPVYPATMTVDRPFVFAIYERSTGAVLFIGQVNKL